MNKKLAGKRFPFTTKLLVSAIKNKRQGIMGSSSYIVKQTSSHVNNTVIAQNY